MIDDLEKLANQHTVRSPWTSDEDEIILLYYRRVPTNDLLRHLPGRSYCGLTNRVNRLKLQGKKFSYETQ
jgi:hypothetical protein